jgi:ABC-type multidrug transport system fused ATPase/permease subunit
MVGALVASSVSSALVEAAILGIVAQVAAALVAGETQVHTRVSSIDLRIDIGTSLLIAGSLVAVRLLLQGPISSFPARIAADVQFRWRTQLFDAFSRASWAAQARDREGHLQELLTSQIVQATYGALQVMVLLSALCSFLVLVASALALNFVAALVVLVACAALFRTLRPLNRIGSRQAAALSQAQMDYASGIGEAIRVAEDVHVFGVGAAQRRHVEELSLKARHFYYQTQLLARLSPNVYQSLIYLVLVAGLAALYLSDGADIASLGVVVLLLVRAGANGQQVQSSYHYVRQMQPFVERLQSFQRTYAIAPATGGRRSLQPLKTLRFDRVSYSYGRDKPALAGISFQAHCGETVGIVGPSGSGKSTLVQLLLQLRTPDSGRYLVNDELASELALDQWHANVAYVPQEPRLLHASVAENIRFLRDLDDAAIERAARLARVHDEIVAWPEGYATLVGPRADAVSGGQQQRICLARALAARPQLLVLDEPTSSLDPHSESLIQASLASLKGELTLFIVAHRMTTLSICDRVMVIVNGALQAFESAALLQSSNAYYRSATSPTTPSGSVLR